VPADDAHDRAVELAATRKAVDARPRAVTELGRCVRLGATESDGLHRLGHAVVVVRRARLGGAAARSQAGAHAGAQLLFRLPEFTLPHLALPTEEGLVRLGELLALAGRLAALHQLLEGRTPVVMGPGSGDVPRRMVDAG
jgi:hypothetical protein